VTGSEVGILGLAAYVLFAAALVSVWRRRLRPSPARLVPVEIRAAE